MAARLYTRQFYQCVYLPTVIFKPICDYYKFLLPFAYSTYVSKKFNTKSDKNSVGLKHSTATTWLSKGYVVIDHFYYALVVGEAVPDCEQQVV